MDEKDECNSKFLKWLGKIQAAFTWVIFGLAIVVLIFIPYLEMFYLTNNFLISIIPTLIALVLVAWYLLKFYTECPSQTKDLIKKYGEFHSELPHHAIIIAHKERPNNNGSYSDTDYVDGIDILINNFRTNVPQINYKVYEVGSKAKLKPIIENPNTTHLWIFGHGKRNSVALHDGGLCYYEVKEVGHKTFIGQYHCNSLFGTSLADYNNPDYRDVTRNARLTPYNRLAVRNKLREMGLE